LVIEARELADGTITSGRLEGWRFPAINTGDHIEIVLDAPSGLGTWAAAWLEPRNQHITDVLAQTQMINWETDYTYDGEADAEFYGHMSNRVEGTVWTRENMDAPTEGYADVADMSTTPHVYGIDLFDDGVVVSVDGEAVVTYPKPENATAANWAYVPENTYNFVANLAVGGDGGRKIVRSAGDDWRLNIQRITFKPDVNTTMAASGIIGVQEAIPETIRG